MVCNVHLAGYEYPKHQYILIINVAYSYEIVDFSTMRTPLQINESNEGKKAL